MTIEAETFFFGRSISKRELKPWTIFTSKEKERWVPKMGPMWDSATLYLTCLVLDPNTIEVRSSFTREMVLSGRLETTLVGKQIEGKKINGRFTTARLSWKP